jgi:hypothetical protein
MQTEAKNTCGEDGRSTRMSEPERPMCPVCGSEGIPVLYGMVGPEAGEAQDRGEVIIAGCLLEPDSPRWGCRNGHRF